MPGGGSGSRRDTILRDDVTNHNSRRVSGFSQAGMKRLSRQDQSRRGTLESSLSLHVYLIRLRDPIFANIVSLRASIERRR